MITLFLLTGWFLRHCVDTVEIDEDRSDSTSSKSRLAYAYTLARLEDVPVIYRVKVLAEVIDIVEDRHEPAHRVPLLLQG